MPPKKTTSQKEGFESVKNYTELIAAIQENPLIVRQWNRWTERGPKWILQMTEDLSNEEDCPEVYTILGYFALILNRAERSTSYFDTAFHLGEISDWTDELAICVYLGQVWLKLITNRGKDAQRDLTIAEKQYPNHLMLLVLSGIESRMRKDYFSAQKFFDRAIKIAFNNPEIWFEKGVTAVAEKKGKEATEYLGSACSAWGCLSRTKEVSGCIQSIQICPFNCTSRNGRWIRKIRRKLERKDLAFKEVNQSS